MREGYRFTVLVVSVSIGIFISLSGIFNFCDKLILPAYLNRKDVVSGRVVAVTVEKSNFSQNKLWPWTSNWQNYLLSFLLDLKPKVLILGPDFLKEANNLNTLKTFLKDKRVLLAYDKGLNLSDVKFSGHMIIEKKGNYFFSPTRYKGLPIIGSLLLKKNFPEWGGIYFTSQPVKFNVIPASKIALAGFLKGEGYQGLNLNDFKNKIIFLEEKSDKFPQELIFLSAQLNSRIFRLMPRGFSLYLGIFLFVILYILLKYLKIRDKIFVSLVTFIICILAQRAYFIFQKEYIELTPLITFGFLGFLTSFLEQQYESRSSRKVKKEMQIARLLKEKDILPPLTLSSDGVFVGVTRYKMDRVGGDFYQFLEFAKGEVGIALGWASGNGLERVKYIMEIVHSWRDFATIYKEPAKVAQVLNNSLFRYGEEGKYTTLIYLLYDAKKGVLKYVNAGHDGLIVINETGDIKLVEAEDPTPLGIARDVPFEEKKIYLKRNNVVMGYSGGISRLILEYGGIKKEFLEHLRQYYEHSPEQLTNEIFHDVLRYYPRKPEEEWSLLILKVMA